MSIINVKRLFYHAIIVKITDNLFHWYVPVMSKLIVGHCITFAPAVQIVWNLQMIAYYKLELLYTFRVLWVLFMLNV